MTDLSSEIIQLRELEVSRRGRAAVIHDGMNDITNMENRLLRMVMGNHAGGADNDSDSDADSTTHDAFGRRLDGR